MRCRTCGRIFKVKPLDKLNKYWKARKCPDCMEKESVEEFINRLNYIPIRK